MFKQIRYLIIVFLFLTITANTVVAQEGTKLLTGKVTDDKNIPLAGATIAVKAVKNTAVKTDANGNYVIKAPTASNFLIVSYVGMKPLEVNVEGKINIDIVLNGADSKLGEVVVVGYGTRRRADVTSSISSITEKDIKNLPVSGVDQAIQGKVAGVTVNNNGGQPGGGVSVRVRGVTSVNGNEPLYVIDGVPIAANKESFTQSFLQGGSGQTVQSVMASLNPADIASIDILKDASAQAIYGSRAANGVVLVTTKRGKNGAGKISYDTYIGWQQVPKKLKVMDLRQFAAYQNSVQTDIRNVAGAGSLDTIPEFKNPDLLGVGTIWQDEIYQIGKIQSHQLAFSGGHDKTTYYFSGGYFNQIGTLLETKFKRYSLTMNVDHQVKSWFRAGVSANISHSDQKIGLSDGFDAVTSTVLYNSPAAAVRDLDGNFIREVTIGTRQFGNQSNPVALATYRDVRAVTNKVFGSVYGELSFLKYFSLRNSFNYDVNTNLNKAFQPQIKNESLAQPDIINVSRLTEGRSTSYYFGVQTYLNFNRDFNRHNVSATLGHEVQFSQYDYINAGREKLQLNLPSLGVGASGNNSNETIAAGNSIWAMDSYFARANYTYNNKYALSVSFRGDGSSTFGPEKRWGYFPAASASWTVTNENFAQGIKNLSYLKLRFGAGAVGNQTVDGNNRYVTNIGQPITGPLGIGNLPVNLGNPELGWESVKTYNAGIDATTLNRKLEITIDLYKKVTTQMLLPTQLPAFSGLGSNYNDIKTPTVNGGQMTNKGIDISITSYNIQSKTLNWKTTLVFSKYKNNLDFLNSPTATLTGFFDEYGDKPLVSLSKQGLPVGSFYGYVTDGIFKEAKELNNGTNWGLDIKPDGQWLGDIRFKDLNGDGKIDENDVTEIGNPNPKFTMGVTNTFSFKGFDLSMFLYGSYGAKIFNYSRRQTEAMSNQFNNQLVSVVDRYTNVNTNTNIPRYNQWHQNNIRISDRYVEDGSYLRIQNISLSYNLPKKITTKAKVASAKFYLSAQNLFTFTNYTGYDPEIGAINSSVTLMNIDNGHYPVPRSVTIGANIEF
jgi:TonB-dependent starch-binding outer membrane protein SusC